MRFRRITAIFVRFAAVLAVMSLLLAPGYAVQGFCTGSEPALEMECGGCCAVTVCCVSGDEKPVPPATLPSGQQADTDFSIALMASKRPLLWLMPVVHEENDSLRAERPDGAIFDPLAVLCVFLI